MAFTAIGWLRIQAPAVRLSEPPRSEPSGSHPTADTRLIPRLHETPAMVARETNRPVQARRGYLHLECAGQGCVSRTEGRLEYVHSAGVAEPRRAARSSCRRIRPGI